MNDLRQVGAHPDHWYPVAWTRDLRTSKPLPCSFAGEPIVIYRGASGDLFALEDRCAHRQVPLHLGVVEGDQLRCSYHGWTYDGCGQCVSIPYIGRERIPNKVRAYPVFERDGLIFVFPGNPLLAEARRPTTLGSASDARYLTRRLNREVACHYTFMHENLFDMNHQFLHRRQMGMIKTTCLGRSQGEGWCEVRYTFDRTAGDASLGESAITGLTGQREDGPSTHLMTIRTDYPYQRLTFNVDETDPVLDVWLCYTPIEKTQRRNHTFGTLSVKKPGVSALLYAVWPFVAWFTERIFREDKDIVEQEQQAYEMQGGDWNREIFPAVRDLRALLLACGTQDKLPLGRALALQP